MMKESVRRLKLWKKQNSVKSEKNLLKPLKEVSLENNLAEAKTFMLEISPLWNSLRSYEELKVYKIDEELQTYLEANSIYMNTDAWIESLTNHMTLYEIHDAIFGTREKELIEKEVIEYITRFLDKQQTTLSMTDRDLGMFNTFKLYEDIDYVIDAEGYVQEALEKLKVEDVEELGEVEDIEELDDVEEIGEVEDIEEIDVAQEKSKLCHECGSELVQIKEDWVCENCDQYCFECGRQLTHEDMTCPSCGTDIGVEVMA